jgi:predicted transcriptional regulator
MQINLTPELAERLRHHAERELDGRRQSEIEVIGRALDLLDMEESEIAAIQAGLDSADAGRVRDFDEFDREFRAKHGLPAFGE